MKRLLFYIGSITFAIVIAFTSIGLIHYVDNQTSNQDFLANSSSTELYCLQQELNELYLRKNDFLTEKEYLLEELSELQQDISFNAQAIEDLESEISSLDQSITTLDGRITAIESDITVIYARLNALSKNIITANLTSNINFSDRGSEMIPLSLSCVVGDKLTLFAGRVLIGDGVSKILVSATMYLDSFEDRWDNSLIIRKNSTEVIQAVSSVSYNDKVGISISPCLVSVEDGDVISLWAYCVDSSTVWGDPSYHYTYMTIEVVE